MIVLDSSGNLTSPKTQNEAFLWDLLEDLRLIKGENPIDVDSGIDYIGVFRGEAFFKVELQNVIDKHLPNFASVELVGTSLRGETLIANLSITFKDGTIAEHQIEAFGGQND